MFIFEGHAGCSWKALYFKGYKIEEDAQFDTLSFQVAFLFYISFMLLLVMNYTNFYHEYLHIKVAYKILDKL